MEKLMFLRNGLILLKPQSIARRSSAVRFCSGSAEPSDDKMEKGEEQQKPPATTGNIMSDSFGHGYATRSDEEGFGGIYGSRQALKNDQDDDQHNHVILKQNESEGSEKKQEEKARN